MNSVNIVGRVARDPERKTLPNGSTVAEFSIAVDKRKSKMSENPEPNWFRVSCFGQQADYVLDFIGKGRLVAITGRLDHRKYQDKDGNNREAISIIADNVQGLDRPREDEGQGKGNRSGKPDSSAKADDFDPFD
ncbi:MAG: single-stranded DNA-binding protein [Labrys sp. (in: a-proteobacteria)]